MKSFKVIVYFWELHCTTLFLLKNYFFYFSLLFQVFCLSQSEPKKFKDKFAEFDYYAKPSKTNDLSKYFKRNIDYTLLENYKFKFTLRKNRVIVLSFRIDKNNKATDLEVSSPYSDLNFSIIKAFKTYDL